MTDVSVKDSILFRLAETAEKMAGMLWLVEQHRLDPEPADSLDPCFMTYYGCYRSLELFHEGLASGKRKAWLSGIDLEMLGLNRKRREQELAQYPEFLVMLGQVLEGKTIKPPVAISSSHTDHMMERLKRFANACKDLDQQIAEALVEAIRPYKDLLT